MFCDQCQLFWSEALAKAHVPQTIQKPEGIFWAPQETILHASICELKHASDLRCRICRIIYTTPTEYEHATLLKNQDEPLHIILTLSNTQGPLPLLQVEFREALHDEARISKRSIASCSGFLGNEGDNPTMRTSGTVRYSTNDLATVLDEASRLKNDHTGSDGALQLASFWVKSCINTHEKCRSVTTNSSMLFLPTRLLDVSNNAIRLVESKNEIIASADRQYIALSHCWGLVPIIRTLQSNYEKHRQGIPANALSKTFREAIQTTRKLGFCYIWIDSMCIIQDNNEDWAAEAATMCDVYQHATLTIAAAHAPGGDVGCFAERDGLLNLPFYVDCLPSIGSGVPTRLQFTTYGRPQSQDLGGGDPALYGRAWVLQEQLLSPRILVFDGTQIKWECLTMHGSESSPTSGATRYDLSQKAIRSGIMDSYEYFDSTKAKEGEHLSSRFHARIKHLYWCNLVMNYTHRGMTNSTDRLVALAGIGQALSRHTKSEYLAGLWSTHFFMGLLWSLAHNEKFLMSATTNFDIEKNKHIRHEQDLAPSWSWASVTAPVNYGQNELLDIDRVCDVQDVEVSGKVDSQTGRVTISGHIRRGYVNAIYPYSIREAVAEVPHMTAPPPAGRLGLEHMVFKDRSFHPSQYFLFSEQYPGPEYTKDVDDLRRNGPFRFVRGTFRPDEIISPTQEITFLAIAQRHVGGQLTSHLKSHQDYDPITTHTLALVPTGDTEGTYRRVGMAMWEDCAWYGYLCGWKHDVTRRITSPREWDRGFYIGEYLWETAFRKLFWDDLEFYKVNGREGSDSDGRWRHEHEYESDALPDIKKYRTGMRVEEKTMVIV